MKNVIKSVSKNTSTLFLALLFNLVFFAFSVYFVFNFPHWIYVEKCFVTGYDLQCITKEACSLVQYLNVTQVCNAPVLGKAVASGTFEQLFLTIQAKFAVLGLNVGQEKECWIRNTCERMSWFEPFDPDNSVSLAFFIFGVCVAFFALTVNLYLLIKVLYFKYKKNNENEKE